MIQDMPALLVIVVIGYILLSRLNHERQLLLTDSRRTLLYESAFADGSADVIEQKTAS